MPGGEQQRQERIVRRLARHDAVKAKRFEPGRLVTCATQVRRQARVN